MSERRQGYCYGCHSCVAPCDKAKGTKYAYMDATDFWHEFGEGRGGYTIYPDTKTLDMAESCAVECGIVRVKVSYDKTARPAKPGAGDGMSRVERLNARIAYYTKVVAKWTRARDKALIEETK